ncbi:MAG TPA: hypothetical protein VEW69_05605 [Alphaproteobacteria bacterium]|nr:hypothetical protein [Alphaproteobacteria bacterium]
MDCEQLYYHRLSIKDLTAAGVTAGTRSELGAPLAHQESESLFVDGRSFFKSTGAWGFDARPYWAPPAGGSNNPKSACEALQQGKSPEDGPFAQGVHFLPVLSFARALAENKIEYLADRVREGGKCREYRVVYQDTAETSRMVTGNGEYTSYALQPTQATVCLDAKSHLPVQIVQGDWTVKYDYGALEKLPAP